MKHVLTTSLTAFLLLCGVHPVAADSVVVFNEIMYHPATNEAGLEYVELYNQLCYDMDISGWSLRGGIDYDFADGTIIPAGGFVVVAISPTELEAETGCADAYGPFQGRLANNGEELRLCNNIGRTMDAVTYSDGGNWPPAADGSGVSLAKIDPGTAGAPPDNWSWSAHINGTPGASNVVHSPSGVAFNEIMPALSSNFWVELVNTGTGSVALTGYTITCAGGVTGQYVFGSQLIGSGGYVVRDANTLGFLPADECKLFLYTPDSNTVVDAAIVKNSHRGRFPEGTGRWLYPDVATANGANSFAFNTDVVINEIMYHHQPQHDPYREVDEEWIELYNRGGAGVDLSGWALDDGIEYVFPPGTILAAYDYLVVANDTNAVQTRYPGVTNLVGNFERTLSNKGELIRLLDGNGNPVDEVRYYEGAGGRWPRFADGRGSSLELRDPRADNAIAEAWAASDESGKSQWQTYTYTGTTSQAFGPSQWNEFCAGLLSAGEVLLDDVSVIKDPTTSPSQKIQNRSFESGTADTWRIIGNHHGQVITDPDSPPNKVLRLTATGPTQTRHNHAETTLIGTTLANGQEYEISFRAKWMGGTSLLNARLYFIRLARTIVLDVPHDNGTPGARNSCYTNNIGPTFRKFGHSPAVPGHVQPVTVSVVAEDPDGVSSATLWWAVDGVSWSSLPMGHQGDGLYTAAIPGQPASTVVQFYVAAVDGAGAASTYPAAGPDSRALYQVDSGEAAVNGLHNFRIIMTSADRDFMFGPTKLTSQAWMGTTVVYNEREAFHDVGVRLRGSPGSRGNDVMAGYSIKFKDDHLFRGVHSSVGIDRSGWNPAAATFQREIAAKHMFNHAGVPGMYDDLVRVIAPRAAQTSSALLQMAKYGDVFLDSQWNNGGDGTVFDLEFTTDPATTTDGDPQSLKVAFPGLPGGHADLTYWGDDKESYRWHLEITNHRLRDDFSGIINFCKIMDLTGAELETQVKNVIDVDDWMRYFALLNLCAVGDAYGINNYHNLRLYVPPYGKVVALPWDIDQAFYNAYNSPLWTLQDADINRIIERPTYKRLYYGYLRHLINTTFNAGYMTYWMQHWDTLLGQDFVATLPFITQRGNYVLSQLPANAVPFEITNANFIVDEDVAVIGGNGWIDFREIYIEGSPDPLDLTCTSTGSGVNQQFFWQATVPLDPGTNSLTLVAYDFQGNIITSDTIVVISTISEKPLRDYLRVTELMHNPADGGDYEFIELCNTWTNSLDLTHVVFTDGIGFAFAGSSVTNLGPGEYVVLVRDLAEFSTKYNTAGMRIAGQYAGALRNEGERVRLQGQWNSHIVDFEYRDGRGWPLAAQGVGHSMVPLDSAVPGERDGSLYYGPNWRASTYMNGSPGQADPAPIAGVVINEIMAHTDAPPPWESDDWIELYNTSGSSVALTADWYLSDDGEDLMKWEIPGTAIGSNGWLTFTETNDFHNPNNTGFGLNKNGEQLFLSYLPGNASDRVVDCVRFKGQESDASLGRYPDGDAYWYALPPTPDTTNGLPGARVVINQLMYHPKPTAANPENNTNDEYIELHNRTAGPVALENTAGSWRIDGGVDYVFPAGATIPAGGYMLLVPFDPVADTAARDAFLEAYGATNGQINLSGRYSRTLDNRSERIALERPQEPDVVGEDVSWVIVDEVIYFSGAPWPQGTDATGDALHRASGTGSGNDPANWLPYTDLRPAKVFVTSPASGTGVIVPFSTIMEVAVDMGQVSGAVHQVEFFEGTNRLHVSTVSPYEYALSDADIGAQGVYSLSATMVDDAGTNGSPDVVIIVYTNRPTAQIDTKDQFLNILDTAMLNAMVNANGLPAQHLSTLWSLESGPGTVDFADSSALDTTATFSTGGTYVLRLTTYGASNVELTNYVTITVISSNTLNRIPYQESFEAYVEGTRLAGMRGWYATNRNDATVVTNDYAYAGERPIAGDHELVLATAGVVSNVFSGTESHTHVWLDMMIEWYPRPEPGVADASAQLALYVNSSSNLVVWHYDDGGGTKTWTELAGTQKAAHTWSRLTVMMDYSGTANRFQVFLDGLPVPDSNTWFEAANTDNDHFSYVTFPSEFAVDDLVVADWDPLSAFAEWLRAHYPGTNDLTVAAESDTDGDGMSAWQEYIAGTDPTDAASVYEILHISNAGVSNCVVWYGTSNNVSTPFSIYSATNLLETSPWWFITNVARDPDGTGINTWWDVTPPTDMPVFYRIETTGTAW